MVLFPRICIWMPPPGAPEFDWRFTPLTRPMRPFSIVGAATVLSASPDTWATAVVALRRSTVVAWPVTTTLSSLSTSRSRPKLAVS
jgi:hypothetical protein